MIEREIDVQAKKDNWSWFKKPIGCSGCLIIVVILCLLAIVGIFISDDNGQKEEDSLTTTIPENYDENCIIDIMKLEGKSQQQINSMFGKSFYHKHKGILAVQKYLTCPNFDSIEVGYYKNKVDNIFLYFDKSIISRNLVLELTKITNMGLPDVQNDLVWRWYFNKGQMVSIFWYGDCVVVSACFYDAMEIPGRWDEWEE